MQRPVENKCFSSSVRTINNYDNVSIGLCTINHESFKIWSWKFVFLYRLITLCSHDLLNFDVIKLHVTNCNGHYFTIISHRCPANNTFHMIKHDPNVLRIPCRLHSCDKVRSTPHTIYQHLENENLLFYNLFWETTLLDVVIGIIRLQFKDVINIAMPWMMLERSN